MDTLMRGCSLADKAVGLYNTRGDLLYVGSNPAILLKMGAWRSNSALGSRLKGRRFKSDRAHYYTKASTCSLMERIPVFEACGCRFKSYQVFLNQKTIYII